MSVITDGLAMNLSSWNAEPSEKAIADSRGSQSHYAPLGSKAQHWSRTYRDCVA
jgi:hypothetical protein